MESSHPPFKGCHHTTMLCTRIFLIPLSLRLTPSFLSSVIQRIMIIPFGFPTLENFLLPTFTLYLLQPKWSVSHWSILLHTHQPTFGKFFAVALLTSLAQRRNMLAFTIASIVFLQLKNFLTLKWMMEPNMPWNAEHPASTRPAIRHILGLYCELLGTR